MPFCPAAITVSMSCSGPKTGFSSPLRMKIGGLRINLMQRLRMLVEPARFAGAEEGGVERCDLPHAAQFAREDIAAGIDAALPAAFHFVRQAIEPCRDLLRQAFGVFFRRRRKSGARRRRSPPARRACDRNGCEGCEGSAE